MTTDDHDVPAHGNDTAAGRHYDQGQNETDCGCSKPPVSPDCDPDLITDLACQAAGVKAQAEYNDAAQPELKKASEDYVVARNAYRSARAAKALEVQDLRHQIKQLIERIRCQIKQDDVIDCLDRAYRCVYRKLKDCDGDGGCCASEKCDFDKCCPDDYVQLVGRIADYQKRLEHDKACFNELIKEPEELNTRVAKAKEKIDAINAALGGDQATLDLKKLYAQALNAQRLLRDAQIWRGFTCTQDYLDCLCRALTCWTKASDAVSALTGCKAVMDCRKAACEEHCNQLRENTVEEILLEYERLCGKDSCDDDPCDDDSDDDSDDCEDDSDDSDEGDSGDDGCGSDHGHSHRRPHHKRRQSHDDATAG